MIKRVFVDIETSPNVVYSWNIGYKVNINHENIIEERKIICICWKWEHEEEVHSLHWTRFNDKTMLKKFVDVLNEAQEVVTHNGNKFDLPWLNTRMLFHRLPVPGYYKSIDTCQIARRKFYFNSNKLDYLAQYLFKDRKEDNGGFKRWADIMRGDKQTLEDMVKYCKKDVILLEHVFQELRKYEVEATHYGVTEDRERWSCPRCGSENVKHNKTWYTKAGLPRYEFMCKDCSRHYSVSKKVHTDYLYG